MQTNQLQAEVTLSNRLVPQLCVLVFVVILTSNISALVDAVIHPEIGYIDLEHIIVGGFTGGISAILFGFVMFYAHHFKRARVTIKSLESLLPICSNCKKIRLSEGDPMEQESWQPIERYFAEHTSTSLTHGICPSCARELYPELQR